MVYLHLRGRENHKVNVYDQKLCAEETFIDSWPIGTAIWGTFKRV